MLDRIRAKIDAFDSIRKHIHQSTIVIKPKVDENKGNIKNEKKNGIIVCDAFSVEELLGAQILKVKAGGTMVLLSQTLRNDYGRAQQQREVSDTERSTKQGILCFTGVINAVFRL